MSATPPSAVGNSQQPEVGDGILQRSAITLIGAILGGFLVFFNEVLAARFLGVSVFGLYALALVVARIAEIISLFGLRSGIMRFLPVYRSEHRQDRVFGTIIAALALPVFLGVSVAFLVWQSAPWIASEILGQPAAMWYVRFFVMSVPFMCLTEMLGVITRGFGFSHYYVLIRNIIPPATYTVGLVILIVFRGDPLWITGGFGAGQVIASAIGFTIVARLIARDGAWVRPSIPFSKLYIYSLPILLNTLLYALLGAIDIAMLGNLRGVEDAGIYRACSQVRQPFDMALLAFNAAAIHLYPVLFEQGRREELAAIYQKVTRWVVAVTSSLFLLVMLSRIDILSLMGPGFALGANALLLLLISYLIQTCLGSAGVVLLVTGHQMHETLDALAAVIANIGLNLLLIPRYGTVGAATSMVAAILVMNLLRAWQVRRYLGLTPVHPQMIRALATVAGVTIIALALMPVLGIADGTGITAMVLRTLLVGGLLLGGLWFFMLTDDERKRIRGFFVSRWCEIP